MLVVLPVNAHTLTHTHTLSHTVILLNFQAKIPFATPASKCKT